MTDEGPPLAPKGRLTAFLAELERITTWKQAFIIAFLVATVAGAIVLILVYR